MAKITDKLFTVTYKEDTGRPHIEIIDQAVCADQCEGKEIGQQPSQLELLIMREVQPP